MSIIINPGTEKQLNHSVENAIAVAVQIAKDLGLPEDSWKRNPDRDDKDGWYAFKFNNNKGIVDVDIPGVEAERVIKGEPWYSPRLYVDGSSWLYGYALGFIAGEK